MGAVRSGCRCEACWKMALLASADGGAHVELEALRHRSESDARMLMHTVRWSGWSGELVLKLLASARCCSLICCTSGEAASAVEAAGLAVLAAASICSAGMVSVCWSCWDRSRGSVRTDMVTGGVSVSNSGSC